ncbi:MAG: hypothetical protein WCD86_07625 [Ktedonobacteraceae bacterium]
MNNDKSSLLPPLVLLSGCQNNWDSYLETIYASFCQDFVISKPVFEDKRFALKRHPIILGKEATFWHIISEGDVENEHLPDLRRCERIRWPRSIIDNAHSGHIKYWKNTRKGEGRIVLALEDFSYVVILSNRGEYILLWTAYCVEREHSRRKLWEEYKAYDGQKG